MRKNLNEESIKTQYFGECFYDKRQPQWSGLYKKILKRIDINKYETLQIYICDYYCFVHNSIEMIFENEFKNDLVQIPQGSFNRAYKSYLKQSKKMFKDS